jgi:hypothetical protein
VSEGELVLVVPRASLMPDPGWHGVSGDGLAGLEDIVARDGEFPPPAEGEIHRWW